MDLGELNKAMEEIWDAPIRDHARRLITKPLTFWPDERDSLSPEQKKATLEWIDTAPIRDVAEAAFPDPDEWDE